MAKTQKKQASAGHGWWNDDPQLVDNPDVPAPKVGKYKFLYWWVIAAAFLLPVSLLANLVLFQEMSKPVEAASDSYRSEMRAVATQTLTEWLSSTPEPIPAAQVLSWEGYETIEVPAPENTQALPISTELHTFAVASGQARFRVTVTVAVVEGSPDAIGVPAVEVDPIVPIEVDPGSLWGARASLTATPDVEEAVRSWSQALLSGDATRLRQAVGDGDLANSYVPFHGTTWLNTSITQMTSADLATATNPSKSTAFGRVEISYMFGQPDPAAGTTQKPALMQFDVLIENADTGTPRVVAWGAAGTAPTLEPYRNASVLPSMVVVTPSAEPVPTTTDTTAPADPGAAPTEES